MKCPKCETMYDRNVHEKCPMCGRSSNDNSAYTKTDSDLDGFEKIKAGKISQDNIKKKEKLGLYLIIIFISFILFTFAFTFFTFYSFFK